MSRAGGPSASMIEEARLAQASSAARAERQNQPRVLLYGAGLLMVAALVFLGLSFRASLTAGSELKAQKKTADGVIMQAAELKALREKAAGDTGLNQPVTQILTRIEQAGVDAGLKNRIQIPIKHSEKPPGLGSTQSRFDYEVKDESLPKLLQWMQKASADVPGLEVYSVSIRPEAHQWVLRVSFSRWERTEGS